MFCVPPTTAILPANLCRSYPALRIAVLRLYSCLQPLQGLLPPYQLLLPTGLIGSDLRCFSTISPNLSTPRSELRLSWLRLDLVRLCTLPLLSSQMSQEVVKRNKNTVKIKICFNRFIFVCFSVCFLLNTIIR